MLLLRYYIVYFLLYLEFNGALSVSDYIASNIRVNGELETMDLYTSLLHPTFS